MWWKKDKRGKYMGKIFYVMGKSASGKDTIYKKILERVPELKRVIPYTTRPIRVGERDGVEYYFTTEEELNRITSENRMIEMRTYQTVLGPWSYGTVNDGQIDLRNNHYLMIGTLESYEKTRDFLGNDKLIPIYVDVEDGERLTRALVREKQEKEPKYAELCRRFLADEEDFSDSKLKKAGIEAHYDNGDMEHCLAGILEMIQKQVK